MLRSARISILLCLSATLGFAESWSGALVDAKCYGAEERNVNPTDTSTYVDRDRNLETRYCSPTPKTRAFSVVLQDGLNFKLDSAGNGKAAELVRRTGKKSPFAVAITGGISEHTIRVDSISLAK
jgi:hypothetical protein